MWNLRLSCKEPILPLFLQSSAFGLQRVDLGCREVLLAVKGNLAMSMVGNLLRGC